MRAPCRPRPQGTELQPRGGRGAGPRRRCARVAQGRACESALSKQAVVHTPAAPLRVVVQESRATWR